MNIDIQLIRDFPEKNLTQIIPFSDIADIGQMSLETKEKEFITGEFKADKNRYFPVNRYGYWIFLHYVRKEDNISKFSESCRKAGDEILEVLKRHSINEVLLVENERNTSIINGYLEGMALGSYVFSKYKTLDKEDIQPGKIFVLSKSKKEEGILEISSLANAVFYCRDLVNEPLSHLNAVKLAESVREAGEKAGIHVEVFNKKKIEALKMGGLLAVNKGSIDPPTFTIMEWKPENALNTKPVVLVGKGVVYDTGGMNIKTGSYMNDMKCDMAGAATMASVALALAWNKIPLHVVVLLPATDNRLDGNAYVPGDVIKMYEGITVEVLNTDAEGRLIMADALSYARKYDPELVIDAATLTGAAARAIGQYGLVAMQTKAEEYMNKLKLAGNEVYERIAEFPFWDEYGELIKSDVADIKNIGGPEAGMITAGKFLEKFTAYPYVHLDIAGVAFYSKKDSYRPKGGTGIGVRLLYQFLSGLYR